MLRLKGWGVWGACGARGPEALPPTAGGSPGAQSELPALGYKHQVDLIFSGLVGLPEA